MNNNQKTGRLALAGVFSALALVFLLFTYIPTATIALAAVAALCGVPVVVELGMKSGLLHYAAVAVLAVLIAFTAEGTGLYIAFFGWYTVFKAWIEGKNLPRAVEWTIKIVVFAVAIAAYGAAWIFLLHMPLPEWFTLWMLPVFAVALCAVFAVYDVGLTRMVSVYIHRIRPKINNIFRF